MTKARQRRSATGRTNITDRDVRAYLRANPDFLCAHPALLESLQIPARQLGGGDSRVVDIQHYMLDHLRAQARDLKHRHDELLANSRGRLHAQSRIHAAALALLGARDLPHLIDIATTDLAVLMDMDVVALCVESADVPRVTADGVRLLASGCIEDLLGRRDILIHEQTTGDTRIYGAAAGLVEAQILLRLRVRDAPPDALLALGSCRASHIHRGQSTEALGFLARILEHCVRSWLEYPA